MAKRRREGARFAEAELEGDLGHRAGRLCQQRLGAFDAAADVIAVWRNAERLLEGAAEIVGAQMNELRQRIERYRLGEVFLDVCGNEALLPNGEAAPHRRCAARNDTMAAHELMRDHHAKRLG